MVAKPVQPNMIPLTANSFSRTPTETNKFSDPFQIDNQITYDRAINYNEKRSELENTRDSILLSQRAEEFLQTAISQYTHQQVRYDSNKAETAAIEYRGLNQLSASRELSGSENSRLNQIIEDFTRSGLDEKNINLLAEKTLQKIKLEAPQLITQLNEGNITGSQFERLSNINELLNKANGYGVSDDRNFGDRRNIETVRSDISSITQTYKERPLPPNELANVKRLAVELGTIQDFRINVLKTVGSDGLLV